ncbi:hypothetical protein [Piscinibacter sp.]|uniref:hypothetical protein n=1 Tax=Piscinibacter sp. TaxID=1903157 RepID=UPI001DAD9BE9|nr:hypothetical protein [Piscinibacter sp.]MBK7532929.1 hypothetical protein [Piscinibacter sp.]
MSARPIASTLSFLLVGEEILRLWVPTVFRSFDENPTRLRFHEPFAATRRDAHRGQRRLFDVCLKRDAEIVVANLHVQPPLAVGALHRHSAPSAAHAFVKASLRC